MSDQILSNIYTDKDTIQKKALELLKQYEDLNNIDMTKVGFHTYIIELLTFLTADTMFYSSMNYSNNFMIVATLQEAIYNWSSYLSYNIELTSPSYVNALIYFQKDFDTPNASFTIPRYTKFYADEITFMNDVEVVVTLNAGVFKIQVYGENYNFIVPYEIDGKYVKFNLLLKQFNIEKETILVNNLVEPFQYYRTRIKHNDSIYKLDVINTETDFQGLKHTNTYQRILNMFSAGPNDKVYTLHLLNDSEFELSFGNGKFGKQLLPNSVLEITKYTTLGTAGRIIKGALKTMDRIYTQLNGISQIVDINVTNVTDGYGGKDVETKEEIKENSIRQFRSKSSITSEADFTDFIKIIGPSTISNTKAVLKRSDLKTNEIVLFHTLTLSSEDSDGNITKNIIPTNSLTKGVPENTYYLPPYTQFTDENIDYYCPFGIQINPLNKTVSYIYYLNSITLLPLIDNLDMVQYPVSFEYIHTEIDSNQSHITFELKYVPINSNFVNTNLTGHINLKYPNYTFRAGEYVNDPVNNLLTLTIDVTLLQSGPVDIISELYYNGVLFAEGGPSAILMQNLDGSVESNFIIDPNNNDKIILDIPVFEKTYIDNLVNPDDRENFEFSVVQNFLSLNLTDRRAMNYFINNKFTKTIGKITNYFYNKSNYEVIDIIDDYPSNPSQGELYIPSFNATDPFLAENRNNIIMYNNSGWELFITPAANDIATIINQNNAKFTFTGIRWFHVDYSVNVPIILNVFIDPSFKLDPETVKSKIKKLIVSHFKNKNGPDKPIYRSEITSLVQAQNETLGVVFCELNKVETDLLFNYNIDKDLTKEELMKYVPEYIHIKEDDIIVLVKILSSPERF